MQAQNPHEQGRFHSCPGVRSAWAGLRVTCAAQAAGAGKAGAAIRHTDPVPRRFAPQSLLLLLLLAGCIERQGAPAPLRPHPPRGDDAAALLRAGRYAQAVPLLQARSDTLRRTLGPAHRQALEALMDLAAALDGLGDARGAEALYLKACHGLEPDEGQDPATRRAQGRCLARVGQILWRLGHYGAADLNLQRAARIQLDPGEPVGPEASETLIGIGLLQQTHGLYPDAEGKLRRACALLEGPARKQELARALLHLGNLHLAQGAVDLAEPVLQRARGLILSAGGPDHPDLAVALRLLGQTLLLRGALGEAEALTRQSLRLMEATLPHTHPETAPILEGLAAILLERGRPHECAPLLERALRLRQDTLHAEHPALARTYELMGEMYRQQGALVEAERAVRAALRQRAALSPEHPEVLPVRYELAEVLLARGSLIPAEDELERALFLTDTLLGRERNRVSDDRLAAYAALARERMDVIYELAAAKRADQRALSLALAAILIIKGRAEEEAAASWHALHAAPQTARAEIARLRALREELARLSFAAPGGVRDETAIGRLRAQIDEGEAALADYAGRPFRVPGVDTVLNLLPARLGPDRALLEFVTFRPAGASAAARFLALSMYAEEEKLRIHAVDLGPAAAVESAAARLRAGLIRPDGEYLPAAQELHRLLIHPVRPFLGGRRRLVIAPEGVLHLVPFSVLADGPRPLGEDHEISYVTSGRDLLRWHDWRRPRSGAVILADPDFASAPAGAPLAASASPAGAAPAARSLILGPLAPLPGARDEARALAAMLPGAQVYLGASATKARLLTLVGPGLLHIATHGVFLDDAPPPATAVRGFGVRRVVPPNPLLRSALLFSGAGLPGGAAMAGTLTGLEAAGLDLAGTELVVLSACETGRGTIRKGEGVYGLRRALLVAGAESLLSSLWRVSDQATRDLMVSFYQGLLRGRGRAAALQEAERAVRARRPHPYYWAPFVLFGRSDALRGLTATQDVKDRGGR